MSKFEKLRLVTKCTDYIATAEELHDMLDDAKDVSFETFFKHVSLKEVSEHLGYSFGNKVGLHLQKDQHVKYYRSKFLGVPCYFLKWSAIEHIFVSKDSQLKLAEKDERYGYSY